MRREESNPQGKRLKRKERSYERDGEPLISK